MRSIDPLLMIIFLNAMLLLSIGLFIPTYNDLKVNKSSGETCRDAGGIELPHIFYFDYKNNKWKHTCLSVNAVIDVE
jgi:hypothetical protein